MRTVEMPELWTLDEVAVFLRVSRASVYRYAQQGELPTVRVGGLIRVNADELRQMTVHDDRVADDVDDLEQLAEQAARARSVPSVRPDSGARPTAALPRER